MASSSSSVQQKHQVFLSFRGEDTRYNFTSHLYGALQRKAIETFIDNELKRGEEISPALLKAIEESKISIVILSEHYASSSWCLDELCKILECKNTHEQMVIPIFFHVDPSDVRKQTGSFAEAFAKHEENLKEGIDKVQRWRDALKEIGKLSGWPLQKDRSEFEFIEEIVKYISQKLIYKSSYDSEELVGLDSRIKQIESLLHLNSVDVRIVGIWGIGGIGKTTLAEAVFNHIFTKFEVYCFLPNVREELERHGQVQLWEKLLSTILEERNLCRGTRSLPNFVKDRLSRKKALIILDDVSDSLEFDHLLKKNCFGPGSRIIVTSIDKQVLRQIVDEDDIYEVKKLIDDEALQLFSLNAFKQRHPMEDWMELSNKVIDYAKGLPLALKVLGSALHNKSKREWESELKKLKKIPNPKIHNLLRISYDGLDSEVKDIFLDIACFFRGKNRDYVAEILGGCYSSVYSGIGVLIDKSLVNSPNNMLEMHNLIQEMGWNIVRQESIKEPGKRSRLWTPEDVYHVLKNNSGTEAVEGITLDMSKIKEVDLSCTTFERMFKLRLLKFYYSDFRRDRKVHLPQEGLESLSDKLCYLHWDGYPLTYLPSNFCAENLVELNMTHSHVKQLWNADQNVVNLKRLNLSHSQHLMKIPDLSHATNLESMTLDGCTNLVEVPSSIGYLNKLSYLSLRECENVRNLPNIIHLRSLTTLMLTGCLNITQFPEVPKELEILYLNGSAIEEVPSSVGCLSGLKILHLQNSKNLKRLPSSFCKLKLLKLFNLSCCSKLKSFPEILESMEKLEILSLDGAGIEELPSSIEHLIDLQTLDLRNCKKLKNLPSCIWKLKYLDKLSLSGCSNLLKFPEAPEYFQGGLYRIQELNLQNCKELESLPNSITDMKSLYNLDLAGCSKLVEWPNNLKNLKSLSALCLTDCNLLELPSYVTYVSSLNKLDLRGNNFESIPPSIKQLSALRSLDLSYCKRLRSIPELPPSLFHLDADCCTSLEVVSRWSLTWVIQVAVHDVGWVATFAFTNCLKLDQLAMGYIAAEAQLRIQQSATELAGRFSSLRQQRVRDNKGIRQEPSLVICFLGSEIPEWFHYQSTGSTITTIQPQLSHECICVGFTLCVVVAIGDYNHDSGFTVSCKCQFKSDYGDSLACFGPLFNSFSGNRKTRFASDHVFLGYDFWLSGEFYSNNISFDFHVEDMEGKPIDCCKVKKCGVHPIYIHNDNLVSIHWPVPCGSSETETVYQDFGEDDAVIERCRVKFCYIEATPNKNSSSNEEEEEPFCLDGENRSENSSSNEEEEEPFCLDGENMRENSSSDEEEEETSCLDAENRRKKKKNKVNGATNVDSINVGPVFRRFEGNIQESRVFARQKVKMEILSIQLSYARNNGIGDEVKLRF